MLKVGVSRVTALLLACAAGYPGTAAAQQTYVAYTDHAGRPDLTDMRVSRAEFGAIGALVALSEGHSAAETNDIQTPAGDMAAKVARAYADTKSNHFLPEPIRVSGKFSPSNVSWASLGQRPRYIVDVPAVSISILYALTDWTSFDIVFVGHINIYDVDQSKVIAHSRCTIRGDHSDHFSHSALLENGAANLKALIKRRADQCVAKFEADFSLSTNVQPVTNVEPIQTMPLQQVLSTPTSSGDSGAGRTAATLVLDAAADSQQPGQPAWPEPASVAPPMPPPNPSSLDVYKTGRVVEIRVLANGAVQEIYGR